jgi:hypothetical protein
VPIPGIQEKGREDGRTEGGERWSAEQLKTACLYIYSEYRRSTMFRDNLPKPVSKSVLGVFRTDKIVYAEDSSASSKYLP